MAWTRRTSIWDCWWFRKMFCLWAHGDFLCHIVQDFVFITHVWHIFISFFSLYAYDALDSDDVMGITVQYFITCPPGAEPLFVLLPSCKLRALQKLRLFCTACLLKADIGLTGSWWCGEARDACHFFLFNPLLHFFFASLVTSPGLKIEQRAILTFIPLRTLTAHKGGKKFLCCIGLMRAECWCLCTLVVVAISH